MKHDKRTIFFCAVILLACHPLTSRAQLNNQPNAQSSSAFEKQIDEEVWKPFAQYFEAYETDKFMELHDTSMKRIVIDKKRISNFYTYQTQVRRSDSLQRAQGTKRQIEFTFTKCIANNYFGFEEGYYKTSIVKSNGEISVYFGKFWVTLINRQGKWLITLDADTSEGITEANYESAKHSGKMANWNSTYYSIE